MEDIRNDNEILMMDTETGQVQSKLDWYGEHPRIQNIDDRLVEVVRNIEGQPGYDPTYGDWREA